MSSLEIFAVIPLNHRSTSLSVVPVLPAVGSAFAALVPVLETGAERVTDVVVGHLKPLFKKWKDSGQIYADLDVGETADWMSATTSFLLTTQWRHRPAAAKKRFVDRYLIRALVR